jgi:tetratricopeptide (TPR) repeat protein
MRYRCRCARDALCVETVGHVRTPIFSATPTRPVARGDPLERRVGLTGLGLGASSVTRQTVPAQSGGVGGAAAGAPAHLYELGLTTAAMGFHAVAIKALCDCTNRVPGHAAAWRKLAQLYRLANDEARALAADAAAGDAEREPGTPDGETAGGSSGQLTAGQVEEAERKLSDMLRNTPADKVMAVLRNRLVANPRGAAAMRRLARLELLDDDNFTAWRLLERALDLCPGYVGAREDYAQSLLAHRFKAAAAARETRILLDHAPQDERYRRMHAYAMLFTSQFDAAAELFAGLLRDRPHEATYWHGHAEALNFLGRRDESERAYRQCLVLKPDMGQAYLGLSDLKAAVVTPADVAAMRSLLDGDTLEADSRTHMLYAMGQTLERAGAFDASFAAYEAAAKLFRAQAEKDNPNGRERIHGAGRVRRAKAVFSRENLATRLSRARATQTSTTPIFIVGMPRAGSTLVEQILASHSLVEGTHELPVVGNITRALAASRLAVDPDAYPECVLDLSPEALAGLGAQVIENARDFRRTDRPWFIDKRPWNWLEVGLIHLMLPQAKIIDIRREPMAACFAMYKQMLPSDAGFSYDLEELGRYYNTYVSLMEHWQSVLPGRVHFVRYEHLVEDTEREVRGMLAYCGLPFEEGCLRFWENDRAVATPSAGQVRRPIFRDALQQWRNFEPWLGPLEQALARPAEA